MGALRLIQLGSLIPIAALLLGRDAQAEVLQGYSVLETINYEYDAQGYRVNRLATVSGVKETPLEAEYDLSNRLIRLTLKGQGANNADLSCTLDYDLNGNLNSKSCTDNGSNVASKTQFTWDARNRLTNIQSSGLDTAFKYDAFGRRIERNINGEITQYLYDGSQAIAELRNKVISTQLLTGSEIDEVIARYTAQGERTLLTDALGSVLIAAQEDSNVVTAYGYSPYGETQVMGSDEGNTAQYTAREKDETGLYYYRARYYDPQVKRFISEDPSSISGGLNFYVYAGNNPARYVDPLGLAPGEIFKTLDAAAQDAHIYIESIYGGSIYEFATIFYQLAPCEYSYTIPMTQFNPTNVVPTGTLPPGYGPGAVAGDYHTHPRDSGQSGENFSDTDTNNAYYDFRPLTIYLGTPSGALIKYNPITGPGGRVN